MNQRVSTWFNMNSENRSETLLTRQEQPNENTKNYRRQRYQSIKFGTDIFPYRAIRILEGIRKGIHLLHYKMKNYYAVRVLLTGITIAVVMLT